MSHGNRKRYISGSLHPPLAGLAHCTNSRDLYPGTLPYVAHTPKEPWNSSKRLVSLLLDTRPALSLASWRVRYYMARRMTRPPAYKPIKRVLD